MSESWSWSFFLTAALIVASVIDDLRSRKVHNYLVIAIFVVSLAAAAFKDGWAGAFEIPPSILAAFIFCLPLYLIKAIGGGDVKLLIALSPLMSWPEVGWTLVFSLVWGALLGIVMMITKNQFRSFVQNLKSMALRNPVSAQQLHKIPYTIAIFFGFLTQASLAQRGVSLL